MKTIIDDKGIETKPGPTGLDVYGTLTVNDKPVPTIDEYRNLMRALAFVPDFDQRLHDMQQKINELEEKLAHTTEAKLNESTIPVVASDVEQSATTPARKKR